MKNITPERKQLIVSEALALDIWNMRRLTAGKRYVLVLVLIDHRWTQSLDQLTTLFIKIIQEIESTAIKNYTSCALKKGNEASTLISTLRDIWSHWGDLDDDEKKCQYVDQIYS